MAVNRAGIIYGEIANAVEPYKNKRNAAHYIASLITLLWVGEVFFLNLQTGTNNGMVIPGILSEALEKMERTARTWIKDVALQDVLTCCAIQPGYCSMPPVKPPGAWVSFLPIR